MENKEEKKDIYEIESDFWKEFYELELQFKNTLRILNDKEN